MKCSRRFIFGTAHRAALFPAIEHSFYGNTLNREQPSTGDLTATPKINHRLHFRGITWCCAAWLGLSKCHSGQTPIGFQSASNRQTHSRLYPTADSQVSGGVWRSFCNKGMDTRERSGQGRPFAAVAERPPCSALAQTRSAKSYQLRLRR